jgi:ribonuclease-3
MSFIKPGKIVSSPLVRAKKEDLEEKSALLREIWDDYAPKKKKKREVSFERDATNRLVSKAPIRQSEERKDQAGPLRFDADGDKNFENEIFQNLDTLEKKLGYVFKNKELLQHALTHRSALGVKDRADYERLEFLGDAVLDLSVAHLLSDKHPDAKEGELSKMRAALVNTQALSQIAKELELGPFIRLGRGEISSGGAERPSILADVMEAVIGALYRDSSYDVAFETVDRIFGSSLDTVLPSDPKTELQEALHVAGSESPQYLLEMVEGPEHAPTFVTVVLVDGEIAGRGRSSTKKASQQLAASEALARMFPSAALVKLKESQSGVISDNLLQPGTDRNNTTSQGA